MKVLIAEDDPIASRVLEAALLKLGHTPLLAVLRDRTFAREKSFFGEGVTAQPPGNFARPSPCASW